MRELKFRAWIKPEGKMVVPDRITLDEGGLLGIDVYKSISLSFEPKTYGASKIVLMQFTGLKDKHGKEIYDGDILEADVSVIYSDRKKDLEYKRRGRVGFAGGSFHWDGISFDKILMKRTGDGSGTMLDEIIEIKNRNGAKEEFRCRNFEIIGNIYEHPHLLEGGAE